MSRNVIICCVVKELVPITALYWCSYESVGSNLLPVPLNSNIAPWDIYSFIISLFAVKPILSYLYSEPPLFQTHFKSVQPLIP